MERLLTRPVLIFLAALCLALVAVSVVQTVRLSAEQAAHAATKNTVLQTLQDISEKTRKAQRAAQRARDAYNTSTAQAALDHAKGVTDAYEKGVATARSLLSGDARLQEHWRGCPAPAAGGDPAAESRDKVLSARRAESAGRIIAIGAAADNDYALVYGELIRTRTLLAQCYEKKPE